MKIPEYFYRLKKFVILPANGMFVNGNASVITSARKITFMTVEHILSQKAEQLSKILNKLIKLYVRGGFIIRMIMM